VNFGSKLALPVKFLFGLANLQACVKGFFQFSRLEKKTLAPGIFKELAVLAMQKQEKSPE